MQEVVEVYKVRVNYKSGIQEEFECTDCTVTQHSIQWVAYGCTGPLHLNYEEVESVWRLSKRTVLQTTDDQALVED